jgi:membrane-anchored protein YejM (alkaline phosphatase superfamily)
LQDLQAKGAFDNTLVMILGDHGNRYDHFRKTTLGRIEDKMPLLGIILPESLKHFRNNLESNSEVLTSWYDVHEMLLDVASGNLNHRTKQV